MLIKLAKVVVIAGTCGVLASLSFNSGHYVIAGILALVAFVAGEMIQREVI